MSELADDLSNIDPPSVAPQAEHVCRWCGDDCESNMVSEDLCLHCLDAWTQFAAAAIAIWPEELNRKDAAHTSFRWADEAMDARKERIVRKAKA